jgi:multidrug efflux pump subunit AcrA (membrane-fusion protein)
MKAYKLFGGVVLGLILAGAGYLSGVQSGRNHSSGTGGIAKEETLYTCGMHPQVIQSEPGNCSICQMKLTPIRRVPGARKATVKYYKSTMNPGEISQTPGKDSMGMDMVPVMEEMDSESAAISIDPVTVQNMGIRTERLSVGPLRRTIRTVGTIDFDESGLAEVSTKFDGWVEKLYVDAMGSQVHRGDPLFEIYSPELYSAQMEYLLALKQGVGSEAGMEALRQSSRLKLEFWDISAEQIAELEKTGKPKKTLQVRAPIDGFVVEKRVVEGQMVSSGEKLYGFANLSLVWIQSQVYEKDFGYLRLGQEAAVTLSYLPDRKFRGRVTYIYPTVDEKTRTGMVRMEFHNPGYFLKPGMFATVDLRAELESSALLVPDSAVLRSGEKNTVFVALDGGRFDPRTVVVGARAEHGMLQVLSGLKRDENVVVSGQFMLDSESQLREAIRKMREPKSVGGDDSAAPAIAPVAPVHGETTEPEPDFSVYICPMPEHVAIEYDHAGGCPLCGMTLVPVSEELLARIQPGGTIEYYTCPMAEHRSVRVEPPGKCPVCAMTLIPVMKANSVPLVVELPVAVPGPLPPKLYTCPMKIHADVVSEEPGDCPKCNMKLVDVSTVAHRAESEAHWRQRHPGAEPAPAPLPEKLYTCPMKIHADVVSEEPGDCPKCNMKLVDVSTVAHRAESEAHWRQRHPGAEPAPEARGEHVHE